MRGEWIAVVIMAGLAANAQQQRLEKSPRHQEWVTVRHDNRAVTAFVVYPEVKQKADALVVIHENMGLTDWVRSVADRLAEAGFIAIAPDLLSGMAPGGGRTSDFAGASAAREAIYRLPPGQVTADLKAVTAYIRKVPAATGRVSVAGFCWGGAQSFRFASTGEALRASYVFYGTGPDGKEGAERIQAPVYGFYGGNDARVNATIPKTRESMKEAGKTYEPVIYEDAGHGFMRAGEEPDASPANRKAREEAWQRWLGLLRQ